MDSVPETSIKQHASLGLPRSRSHPRRHRSQISTLQWLAQPQSGKISPGKRTSKAETAPTDGRTSPSGVHSTGAEGDSTPALAKATAGKKRKRVSKAQRKLNSAANPPAAQPASLKQKGKAVLAPRRPEVPPRPQVKAAVLHSRTEVIHINEKTR